MDSEIKKIRTHKKWTQEEDDIIIENYISKGAKYCKEQLPHRRVDLISERARNLGILNTPIKKTYKWTKDELDFLLKNYSKIGADKCTEYIKRSTYVIGQKASKLGIKLNKDILSEISVNNNKKRQEKRPNSDFKVNVEKFENINTKEVAYFLGYFWADGHVPHKKKRNGIPSISMSISTEDCNCITDTINLIGDWNYYSLKQRKNGKPMTRITTCNTRISNFLIEHDFHLKSKSNPCKILSKIPNDLKKYFFRGLSDGDGCIYHRNTKNSKRITFSISSSYSCDWNFIEEICEKLNIKYTISRRVRKNGSGSEIIMNNKNAKIFCDYIYDGYQIDNIGLTRKLEKYKLITNHILETEKINSESLNKRLLAVSLYKDGKNIKEISEILQKSTEMIRYYLKKSNVKIIVESKQNKVIELLENGFSKKDIHEIIDVSPRTIRNACNKIKKSLNF